MSESPFNPESYEINYLVNNRSPWVDTGGTVRSVRPNPRVVELIPGIEVGSKMEKAKEDTEELMYPI